MKSEHPTRQPKPQSLMTLLPRAQPPNMHKPLSVVKFERKPSKLSAKITPAFFCQPSESIPSSDSNNPQQKRCNRPCIGHPCSNEAQ